MTAILMRRQFTDAIRHGDAIRVMAMIDKDRSLITAQSLEKHFPLHRAVESTHVHIVELLVNGGVDVNATDSNRESAIFFAVRRSHVEITKLLIDGGADVIKPRQDGCTLLHLACEQGNSLVVEMLIAAGAPVNAITRDRYGNSVCHIAAKQGNRQVMAMLIKAGVEVNAVDRAGWSPLHDAMFQLHTTAAKQLIVGGADVQLCTAFERNCAHLAADGSTDDALKLCIAAQVDLNVVDNSGQTPLQIATTTQRSHSITLLSTAHANDQSTAAALSLRREIARLRLNFIVEYATEICIALQSVELPALVTLSIIDEACPMSFLVSMHLKWKLITTIKHYA